MVLHVGKDSTSVYTYSDMYCSLDPITFLQATSNHGNIRKKYKLKQSSFHL